MQRTVNRETNYRVPSYRRWNSGLSWPIIHYSIANYIQYDTSYVFFKSSTMELVVSSTILGSYRKWTTTVLRVVIPKKQLKFRQCWERVEHHICRRGWVCFSITNHIQRYWCIISIFNIFTSGCLLSIHLTMSVIYPSLTPYQGAAWDLIFMTNKKRQTKVCH